MKNDSKLKVNKAMIKDVRQIKKLVDHYSGRGKILPRSFSELYDNVRDFYVCRYNGKVVGCCAMHILWEDIAELKALAVNYRYKGRGIGSLLVKKCVEEAKELGLKRVFGFTYVPEFFGKLGFKVVKKEQLPQKVWGECIKCSKYPNCDEVAMVMELK